MRTFNSKKAAQQFARRVTRAGSFAVARGRTVYFV
jgi:hypothetical protein